MPNFCTGHRCKQAHTFNGVKQLPFQQMMMGQSIAAFHPKKEKLAYFETQIFYKNTFFNFFHTLFYSLFFIPPSFSIASLLLTFFLSPFFTHINFSSLLFFHFLLYTFSCVYLLYCPLFIYFFLITFKSMYR